MCLSLSPPLFLSFSLALSLSVKSVKRELAHDHNRSRAFRNIRTLPALPHVNCERCSLFYPRAVHASLFNSNGITNYARFDRVSRISRQVQREPGTADPNGEPVHGLRVLPTVRRSGSAAATGARHGGDREIGAHQGVASLRASAGRRYRGVSALREDTSRPTGASPSRRCARSHNGDRSDGGFFTATRVKMKLTQSTVTALEKLVRTL